METVWYCCQCSFGPWKATLDECCMNCYRRRCTGCPAERIPLQMETSSTPETEHLPNNQIEWESDDSQHTSKGKGRAEKRRTRTGRKRATRKLTRVRSGVARIKQGANDHLNQNTQENWLQGSLDEDESSHSPLREHRGLLVPTSPSNPSDTILAKEWSHYLVKEIVPFLHQHPILSDQSHESWPFTPYELPDLITELRYIRPQTIQFVYTDAERVSIAKFKSWGGFLSGIEYWTGETWRWWPLPTPLRPLEYHEVRLQWECICGEKRNTKVPYTFAGKLGSIIQTFGREFISGQNTRGSTSSPVNSQISTQRNSGQNPVRPSHQNVKQSSDSSPIQAVHVHSHASGTTIDNGSSNHRLLFMVQKGLDYRLAQLEVTGHTCHTFFSSMKNEYFNLRGTLRKWLSVWRYSHCDFYKFEKFDDGEFVPIKKDAFPMELDSTYEYNPRPMPIIPPISKHEFTRRFYACDSGKSLCRLYHKCRVLGVHSSDFLDVLPKRIAQLEERGDKREIFWGLYAREHIHLSWILVYNAVCTLPLLIYFLSKVVMEHGADLQNPSVPISIMASMLTLFWTMFLSSLHFGKPR